MGKKSTEDTFFESGNFKKRTDKGVEILTFECYLSVCAYAALKSYQEIKKALLGKKYSTDFGLLGSDFRIDVIKKDSKSEIYECYDRGYIIKDDNNSYIFEYGNNWYKEFEAELKKILQDDPYHFMKEEKDRKWKINKNQE